MSTLPLVDRVNTLYNIVYTLQDFWKKIMYTEMSDDKRNKWRQWTRRRLDMVNQYIDNRDNIMGKNNELLKSARKDLKHDGGIQLERTWAGIYVASKYLDLNLRNKEQPLFFTARHLSQDEAMDRLKAAGKWGPGSLRYERPENTVATRLCEARGLKVRFYDTRWTPEMPGRPVLDPNDPDDRRKIEVYLKNEEGRLVVDCDGLVVSGAEDKDHTLLPMPKNVPLTSLMATMPLVSVKGAKVSHIHPTLTSELTRKIQKVETHEDPRVRRLVKMRYGKNSSRVPLHETFPDYPPGFSLA